VIELFIIFILFGHWRSFLDEFEQKYALAKLPNDEEEDGLRDLVRHTMFEKGQSKRIWGELYKVVDSSDVVVQVVWFSCSFPQPVCFTESFLCFYIYCFTSLECQTSVLIIWVHFWYQSWSWLWGSSVQYFVLTYFTISVPFVWLVYPNYNLIDPLNCANSKKALVQLYSSTYVVGL
jgi:hypothetical protein